jgi:tetratricopeptide (TPR) repeat protein
MHYMYDPRKEWEDKAYAEVQKALALDPNLAEAYYARGLLAFTPSQGFQYEAAAADLRRAIEISPSLAGAHYWLAWLYNHGGLLDRALEEAKVAARLDPSFHPRNLQFPLTYLYQHDYQKALGVYEKDPKTEGPEWAHAPALIYLGRDAEARPLVDKWLQEKRQDAAGVVALHALLLARQGEGRKAEEAIARAIPLCEGFGDVHHAQHLIASAYSVLGNKREALVWLEKAANNGLPCYPYFEKDPHLASLRGEPDYQAFMKKLKARWEHYQATL